MSNKGYEQAVQNLAFYIIKYADRDFEPIREEFAFEFDDADDAANKMMQHIEDHPELQADWTNLENTADVVADTYSVPYDQLMADVWKAMVVMDATNPKYWN